MNKTIKNLLFTAAFFLLFIANESLGQSIQFSEVTSEKEWKQLLAKSKKEKKPVFIDIYATWCGPCKKMDKEIFSDASVGELYNSRFINAKIDGESEYGKVLAEAFELTGYPSMYFMDYEQFIYGKIVGFRDIEDFNSFGQRIDEKKDALKEFNKAFDQKKASLAQIKEYVGLLNELGMDVKATEVSEAFITSMSETDILSVDGKSILLSTALHLDKPIVKTVIDKSDAIKSAWGEEDYMAFLSSIFETSLLKAIEDTNAVLKDRIISEFLPVYFSGEPESLPYGAFVTNKYYAMGMGDYEAYNKSLEDYFKQQGDYGQNILVQELSEVLQNNELPEEVLEYSVQWINWVPEGERGFELLYLSAVANVFTSRPSVALEMIEFARKIAVGEQLDELEKLIQFIEENDTYEE